MAAGGYCGWPKPHASAWPIHKGFESFVADPGGLARSGKFFPIIGKRPKNFSNHWKNQAKFSNHWKNIFQSLENFSRAVGQMFRMPRQEG